MGLRKIRTTAAYRITTGSATKKSRLFCRYKITPQATTIIESISSVSVAVEIACRIVDASEKRDRYSPVCRTEIDDTGRFIIWL